MIALLSRFLSRKDSHLNNQRDVSICLRCSRRPTYRLDHWCRQYRLFGVSVHVTQATFLSSPGFIKFMLAPYRIPFAPA